MRKNHFFFRTFAPISKEYAYAEARKPTTDHTAFLLSVAACDG